MGYGNYSHDAHEAMLRGRAQLPSSRCSSSRPAIR